MKTWVVRPFGSLNANANVPRLFETPAAGTLPLFVLDESHVQEIYGAEALRLRLADENPQEKLLDLVRRPHYYADTMMGIRRKGTTLAGFEVHHVVPYRPSVKFASGR